MNTKEAVIRFDEVLSQESIEKIKSRMEYDETDSSLFFDGHDFINGFALVVCGYEYSEFDEPETQIVNRTGDFVDVSLDKNIKYSSGKIVKLSDGDKSQYSFKISRIMYPATEFTSWGGKYVTDKESSYFVIKVAKYLRDEDTQYRYYIIDSNLNVIETFKDTEKFGIEFDGYKNCRVYIERSFSFLDEQRDYIVFSQKLMALSEDDGFYNEHMYGLDPSAYEDAMSECDPDFYERREFDMGDSYAETDFDDETMQKIIKKAKGLIDWDDEEYDDIPDVSEIDFFFDNPKNILYKGMFTEYYRELWGIIDCKHKAARQLLPFTDKKNNAVGIIHQRRHSMKELSEHRMYGEGWAFDDKLFYGYVMSDKFFGYPPVVQGFSLLYVFKYYPDILKWLCENNLVLIPNHILDEIGNNELSRFIRGNQEVHLSYAPICDAKSKLISSEYVGVVSSFHGKTISEIVYSKGGIKILVALLRCGKLEIEKGVLEKLKQNASNEIENKCYEILLSVIEDIEYWKKQHEVWLEARWEEENLREIERQFNDLMDENDAWGNID